MEVMQHLREKVEKKKDAVHQLKGEAKEVIEGALMVARRRSSRRSDDGSNSTTFEGDDESCTPQSSVSIASGDTFGYPRIVDASLDAEMERAGFAGVDDNDNEVEDKSKRSLYLDESAGAAQEESHVENLTRVDTVSAKLNGADFKKVLSAAVSDKNGEILKDTFSSISNLPPSTRPSEEVGTTSVRDETEHLTIDIGDESDEEVIELEFERAVEKMHTHEYNMYCPNCSRPITKVILKRKREKRTKPKGLLGCLSCLSIFIPKGNILNPLNLFGPDKEPEGSPIPQERKPWFAPDSSVPQPHAPGGSAQGSFWTPGKPTVDGSPSSSQKPSVPPGSSYHGISPDGSTSSPSVFLDIPNKLGPIPTETPQTQSNPDIREPLLAREAPSSKPLEILKSIVYGGLMELITSLGIVSSAAASGATTLNVVALGLANLVGGLLVLFHNLKDLKYEESTASVELKSRYQELLGRKENFVLHTIFAVISYLVFGLIPPVVYGFTFSGSDDRDFKIVAVAASSLLCVLILATAKAYTRGQHKFMAYSKTMVYYIIGAAMASGIAYATGHLFGRFLDGLGWFDTKPVQLL